MKNTNYEAFYLCKATNMFSLYNIGCPHMPYMEPLKINATGAMIYEKLRDGYSISEISDYISQKYEIGINESSNDVNAFVDKLRTFGVAVAHE